MVFWRGQTEKGPFKKGEVLTIKKREMKRINLFKIAANVFGLIIVMAALACFSSVLAFGGSVIYAITGAVIQAEPVTVEGVKVGSPDLDKDYISKKVTQMKPAATPLDTIMRQIPNQVDCKSFVSEYYAVDSRPFADTVHTAYTKSGDGHLVTDLKVNNISMWSADDTVMVEGITGVDGLDLVCFIISKDISAATIKIQPLNGTAGSGTTAGEMIIPATIPATTKLTRCGACKHELDAQTSPYAIIPVTADNYLQIFMAQVEESTFQKIHLKEVDWGFSDYEAQNIYDMRATMEFSFIFGVKAKFSDNTNAKERYTTGGATRYITKSLEYGTGGADRTIDNVTFVDWNQSIFQGNSGSDTRLLFGGDGLMANLMKVDTVLKQIEAKSTEVVYGIRFNKIETNHGVLLFKRHPLLALAGWSERGIVLDLNYIEKHTFKPMATRKLSLKESGQRNVDAVVIEETTGLILRYPDTHAIIKPKA